MVNVQDYISGNWLNPVIIKQLGITSAVIITEFIINEDTPFGRAVCEGEVEVRGKTYVLTMNKTSVREISESLGQDTKEWIGKTITLKIERQNVKGVLKDVLYCTAEKIATGE